LQTKTKKNMKTTTSKYFYLVMVDIEITITEAVVTMVTDVTAGIDTEAEVVTEIEMSVKDEIDKVEADQEVDRIEEETVGIIETAIEEILEIDVN
jgi:hypothetical protein